MNVDHVKFMRLALQEAHKALKKGEVPIGCVIVVDGNIVGRGHNMVETLLDSTAHAEIMALRDSAKGIGNWRLTGSTAYVTVEPCPMCTTAFIFARVERIVFGAKNKAMGACCSVWNFPDDPGFENHPHIIGGILADEVEKLMLNFFNEIRS